MIVSVGRYGVRMCCVIGIEFVICMMLVGLVVCCSIVLCVLLVLIMVVCVCLKNLVLIGVSWKLCDV